MIAQLQGAEKESFAEEIKPQLMLVKKACHNNRQLMAIEKLLAGLPDTGSTKRGSVSGPSPASPSLQVDVSSAAPTPVLTMEPNTPQSSSPPSTNAGASDESVDETLKATISDTDGSGPEVRVDEA